MDPAKFLRPFAFLALLCNAACAPDPMGSSLPEAPNEIGFITVERAHTVYFASVAVSPSAEERYRLEQFLHGAEARRGDHIDIAAEPSSLGQAREGSIVGIMRAAGIDDIVLRAASPGSGTVVLTLRQKTAVAPVCDNWPALGAGDVLNAPLNRLGCAGAGNLFQMVVDKRDLAIGRTPGPNDAEPGIRAVQAYRDGKPPAGDNAGKAPVTDMLPSTTGAGMKPAPNPQ